MDKITAIVLAGGQGTRMHSSTPKQYLHIQDKPVLYYSLNVFESFEPVTNVILVVNAGDEERVREEIVEYYHFKKVSCITAGGAQRYDSVYRGLLQAGGSDYVMIHDSARPCIDIPLLQRNLQAVMETGACISAVPVKDTIKIAGPDQTVADTPDRSVLWQIQTPQSFRYDLILNAYEEMLRLKLEGITDDAMAVEKTTGHPVKLVEGSYRNMKVTTEEDLLIADAFLKKCVDRS